MTSFQETAAQDLGGMLRRTAGRSIEPPVPARYPRHCPLARGTEKKKLSREQTRVLRDTVHRGEPVAVSAHIAAGGIALLFGRDGNERSRCRQYDLRRTVTEPGPWRSSR